MAASDSPGGATPPSPAAALGQMIRGSLVTQLLYVTAKLGIADLLGDGPKSADVLAAACGAHPRALYRALRALAHLGILAEGDNAIFALTPLGELLRTGVPGSLRGSAIVYGEPWWWQPFGVLLHSVRTGATAFDHVQGMAFFDYLSRHVDAADTFNAHMQSVSGTDAVAVVAAYDFSGIGCVVDVGGGHGALIGAILRAYPHVRGVLFERAAVLDGARAVVERDGMAGRCELVAGDFFESVPRGGDVYTLKDILHDWDNDRALAILRVCRRAMPGPARLLVVERLIPRGGEPAVGKLVDIGMLVLTGGQERTEVEYRTLLRAAGFELTRVVQTASPMSVIEAQPV